MQDEDTFKAARKLFSPDDEFWDDPVLWRAWLDLVQMAAKATSEIKRAGVKVKVARGQCFVSVRFLAKRWDVTPAKVQRFLAKCERIGRLVSQEISIPMIHEPIHPPIHPPEHIGTLLTLCKYDKYQTAAAAKKVASDTPSDTATDTPLIGSKHARATRTRKEVTDKQITDEQKDSSNEESDLYSKRAYEIWRNRMGGTSPRVRINVALKPLVKEHGADEVLKWWDTYLASPKMPATAKTPENFSQRFGAWRREQSVNGNGCSVDDIRRCLHLGGSYLPIPECADSGFAKIRAGDAQLWERVEDVAPRIDWSYLNGFDKEFELTRAIQGELKRLHGK